MWMRALRWSLMVMAAVGLTGGVAWGIGWVGYVLGETKEALELKYDVAVAEHAFDGRGTGRVTVMLTLADEGRLKPLHEVQLVIPGREKNKDASHSMDLVVAIDMVKADGGKRVGQVHVLRELAERAEIRLNTHTMDGKMDPSKRLHYVIPVAEYLKNAPVPPAAPAAAPPPAAHAAVKTTEDFYAAVEAGELDKAEKLTVPKRYPKEKLQKMKDFLRLDQAKVSEAYIGKEQSAIVTDEIAPREEGSWRKARWGVSLRLVDGNWLIRDFDYLPDKEAVETYLEDFRKAEPNAEKAKLGAAVAKPAADWPPPLDREAVVGMWMRPNGGQNEHKLLWLRPNGDWVRAAAVGPESAITKVEHVERGIAWSVRNSAGPLFYGPQLVVGEHSNPISHVSRKQLVLGPWMGSIVWVDDYHRVAGETAKHLEKLLEVDD